MPTVGTNTNEAQPLFPLSTSNPVGPTKNIKNIDTSYCIPAHVTTSPTHASQTPLATSTQPSLAVLGIKCTRHSYCQLQSSHCQKKREATAIKIALLLKLRRNCQSKSDDSYTKSHLVFVEGILESDNLSISSSLVYIALRLFVILVLTRALGRIVGNKMHKAFPLLVIKFLLPGEVPTAKEESSHWQKEGEATAVKIALLLKSRRNCQSKSDGSYT
nr:hypothetical protein [Tanacetum cinerariifolium]